jgi:peptide/nickel transport system substrate-binding protein
MKLKRKAPVVLLTAAALTVTGCAQSDRESESTDTGTASGEFKDTFTFGAAGAPKLFDPFYATDGETFRVTRQMHQGLLGVKPGTADVQPELAESWTPSADGLTWEFKLKQGVKFSDGEPFNAEAVCANFTRMYESKGAAQTAAEYWGYFFGSFSDKPEGSLYKSCEAKDESTAVIGITRATSSFPTILSLDSFSMQSPKAMAAGDAGNVQAAGEGFTYPPYVMAPVGIGPYKLDKYDEANKTVTLVANDMTTGRRPRRPSSSSRSSPTRAPVARSSRPARIDGYDLPNPVDWKGLEGRGQQRRGPPGVQHPLHGPEPEEEPRSSRTSRFARHSTTRSTVTRWSRRSCPRVRRPRRSSCPTRSPATTPLAARRL